MISFHSNNASVAVNSTDTMTSVDIASILVSTVISVFIWVGNLLTLFAVCHTPALRTVPNLYVVSLAVADLLSGVMMFYQTVKYFPGMARRFDVSKSLCLSRHALLVISVGASVTGMVLISFDRLVYIRFPLKYDRLVTHCRATMVICIVWAVSLLVGTVSLYHNNWDRAAKCTMLEVFTVTHNLYILGSFFAFCCVVIAGCYGYIFTTAYRHRCAISQMTASYGTDVASRVRQAWPLVKMFMIVYGTFLLCWTPCFAGLIVGYTVGINIDIMNFLIPLGAVNSGMNFIIYALSNEDFRSAFKKMICTQHRG